MELKPFTTVQAAHPGRSAFDLSYSKLFTADMGYIYPVMVDEVVPGDHFQISNEWVIRMMPMIAPILHEIEVKVFYFFAPYRILWSGWENFISGGINGQDASSVPRWEPSDTAIGSLWDYMGFPTGVDPDGAYPLQFPLNAYNMIWNQYFRDEYFQPEVNLDDENLLLSNYTKDYFTSALPFQQRGQAVSVPLSGTGAASWATGYAAEVGLGTARNRIPVNSGVSPLDVNLFMTNPVYPSAYTQQTNGDLFVDIPVQFLNQNTIDFSNVGTFDVSDLRSIFQIQKWMERNARCGARYKEFIYAHFGIDIKDGRLQRCDFLGGTKSNLIVSEVLQTSQTTTTGTDQSPQGNMSGHGISVAREFAGTYSVPEYGLIMGLMVIRPKPMYQQGINRQWLRRSKFDFYSPEFANLSEQAIENAEIYATDDDEDNIDLFGYQGRYDEMRYKPNLVCGKMRTDLAHWHLGRIFGSAPDLNSDFLECNPDKRIFAVPSEPGFIVSFGNIIKAVRPLPIVGTPGLIDHN